MELGLFGDHCSPISDSTILASLGAGSDHMAHVQTQLPYAITAAIASIIGYMITALTGNGFLSIIATLVSLSIMVYVLYKVKGRHEIKKAND